MVKLRRPSWPFASTSAARIHCLTAPDRGQYMDMLCPSAFQRARGSGGAVTVEVCRFGCVPMPDPMASCSLPGLFRSWRLELGVRWAAASRQRPEAVRPPKMGSDGRLVLGKHFQTACMSRGGVARLSVARGVEPLDDAVRNPPAPGDLDAVGPGPLPDGDRAEVGLARPGAAVGTSLPSCVDVAGKRAAQLVGVVVGQVDLVSGAVEAEPDGLAVAVLDDRLVQVVDKVNYHTRCHCCSFVRLRFSVHTA